MVVPAVVPNSEDKEDFNGYRYLRRVKSTGMASRWLFTTTAVDMPWFGVGTHECPGRFFADMMIKIALVRLLTDYDWKFKDGSPKPGKVQFAHETVPDPCGCVMYRKRLRKVAGED